MGLREEIAEAEARLARLKQQEAAATCAEVGHRWKHIGGRNAGCGDACDCSVPVHQCEVCGDCDYGDNAEGTATIAACAELRDIAATESA